MSIARTSILRGPAIVKFGGQSFYTKDDIKVSMGFETFDVETSEYGKVDERTKNRTTTVTFTPSGEWEALSVLWPYGAMTIGSSLFTGTDVPLYIQTLDGKQLLFSAAAVTKMPDITLSATKTLIGPVTFTCLGTDNTPWATATSLLTISSNAFSDATFDPANIKTQPYSLVWGVSAPWSSFQTMDGTVVSFDLSVKPLETDSDGIVDFTFEKLSVTAKCRPLGVTEQNLLDALRLEGSGIVRGASLNTGSNDLVISGTGVTVTVKAAQFKMAGYEFGAATPRIGEVEFHATRKFTAGVASALFTVA